MMHGAMLMHSVQTLDEAHMRAAVLQKTGYKTEIVKHTTKMGRVIYEVWAVAENRY